MWKGLSTRRRKGRKCSWWPNLVMFPWWTWSDAWERRKRIRKRLGTGGIILLLLSPIGAKGNQGVARLTPPLPLARASEWSGTRRKTTTPGKSLVQVIDTERWRKNSVSCLEWVCWQLFPQFPSRTPVLSRLWCGDPGKKRAANAGTKHSIFIHTIYRIGWNFLVIVRDWGGELAFPLPHNTSTPRSWLQDEEEVSCNIFSDRLLFWIWLHMPKIRFFPAISFTCHHERYLM